MTPDTNTELILNSLDKVFDQIVDTNTLLRELIDFEKETFGLQSDAWKSDDKEVIAMLEKQEIDEMMKAMEKIYDWLKEVRKTKIENRTS